MPPVRYLNPKVVEVIAPRSPIAGQRVPDVRIGKTLVAAGPRSLRSKHYDMIKKFLQFSYGRRQQNIIDFFPTRGICRRAIASRMGAGQGALDHYVARIPAGKVLVHIPNIVAYQNFGIAHTNKALAHLSGVLPNRCTVRSQFNHFKPMSLSQLQQEKNRREGIATFGSFKASLRGQRFQA